MREATSKELIEMVIEETDCSEELIRYILEETTNSVRKLVSEGKKVTLARLGTFEPYMAKPSRYRNLHTGKMHTKPARRIVRFRVHGTLRKGEECEENTKREPVGV